MLSCCFMLVCKLCEGRAMAAFHQQNESVLMTEWQQAEGQEWTQSVLSHIARLRGHTNIAKCKPYGLSFLSCDSINITFFDCSTKISGEEIRSVSWSFRKYSKCHTFLPICQLLRERTCLTFFSQQSCHWDRTQASARRADPAGFFYLVCFRSLLSKWAPDVATFSCAPWEAGTGK